MMNSIEGWCGIESNTGMKVGLAASILGPAEPCGRTVRRCRSDGMGCCVDEVYI